MDYPYAETGNRIRMLRLEKNLTREKLAEKAEISVQFLADIEKGKKNMTVTTLRKLSNALTVSTDYLVSGAQRQTAEEMALLYERLTPEKRRFALKLLQMLADETDDLWTSARIL